VQARNLGPTLGLSELQRVAHVCCLSQWSYDLAGDLRNSYRDVCVLEVGKQCLEQCLRHADCFDIQRNILFCNHVIRALSSAAANPSQHVCKGE